jgi:hypothetical protein
MRVPLLPASQTRHLRGPMSGAHQPRTRVSLRGPAAIVVECLLPSVLLRVREPGTGLALWRRPTRVGLHRAVGALLATDRFCLTAEGDPGAASRALMRDLPVAGRTLEHDVAFLARLYVCDCFALMPDQARNGSTRLANAAVCQGFRSAFSRAPPTRRQPHACCIVRRRLSTCHHAAAPASCFVSMNWKRPGDG